MVHKRTSPMMRSHHAGHPSPKVTIAEVQELLASGEITGYDKALLLGLITEYRDYTKVFKKLRGTPKVTIFGSARLKDDHPDYIQAQKFAKLMAEKFNYDVITGAGPGIMEAGNRGAGKSHAIGLNISLPFEQEANPYLDDERLVTFYYFMIRKLGFVREADAIVLCAGGLGTLDEAFEALTLIQTGRSVPAPVVLLDAPEGNPSFWTPVLGVLDHLVDYGTVSASDKKLFYRTNSAEDAANYINAFYYHYHSLRILNGGKVSLRLNREVDPAHIARLFEKYSALFTSDSIEFHPHGLEEERDEVDIFDMPRLVFNMDFTKPTDLNFFIQDLKNDDFVANTAEEAHVFPRPRRIKVMPEDDYQSDK